jgi:hypothetical protein
MSGGDDGVDSSSLFLLIRTASYFMLLHMSLIRIYLDVPPSPCSPPPITHALTNDLTPPPPSTAPSPTHSYHPTLYRKSDLCIPRNETARPRSQFLHSCICERFKYSQYRSAYLAEAIWEYINRSQIHECGNWETEHYNSVLEIMRQGSFISGDT